MLLEIDDYKTIGDLQENFNESFPHLKLEFYDRRYRVIKDFHLLFPLPANARVDSIRKKHDSGICTIKSWYKTEKLENELWEIFGLNAKVFRKAGNKWIPLNYDETLALPVSCVKPVLNMRKS